jgi:hypothetical protein
MSIISSIYNTGTGLSTSIIEGQLPIIVDDLIVNGNLTVLGTSTLTGDVACGDNLTVQQTTTTEDLIVNNNTILDNGVGQNNTALFKLPLTNGVNGEVLTITNSTLNPILTDWQPIPAINNYVQYNTGTSRLENNVLAVVSNINDLTVDNSIGISGQRFKLPSNTTTATNNQVLAILNDAVVPKTTTWITPAAALTPTTSTSQTVSTTSNVVTNIVTSPILPVGTYIISYDTSAQNTLTRTFSSVQTCIGFSPTSFSTAINGLFTSSFVSTIALPGNIRETGCSVVTISVFPSAVYLNVLNVFTGANYNTNGTIRTIQIN